MAQMHKILPALTVCFSLLAAPLQARTGAQIAQVFDTGVAHYDAGNYEEAFKIWWVLLICFFFGICISCFFLHLNTWLKLGIFKKIEKSDFL